MNELEIAQIVKALKNSKKVNLAKQIEENWDKTCLEYSRDINNSHKANQKLEPLMKKALTVFINKSILKS